MVEIRKAKKEDLKCLIELDKEANKEISWWSPLNKKEFQKFLKNNGLYVAEIDKKIISYQSVKKEKEILILEDVYVKKEHRKKGIAKKLIEKVISDFKKYKIKQIKFNCPERLRGFYEKLGFKVTSLVMKKEIR